MPVRMAVGHFNISQEGVATDPLLPEPPYFGAVDSLVVIV